MIYYLYISGIITMCVFFWYDASLEDEFLRNKALSESDRELICGLMTKNAKPRFFLRRAMFLKRSWSFNNRVRFWLLLYFGTITHLYAVTILYFTLFD